jgi:hypothetical protein
MTEAQTDKTKTGECETKCQMCEKKEGLPILLTRYVIAPNDANAPKLGGDFKMKYAPALGAATHYTQRLLRGGYVYVYNEAAEAKFQIYMVTPQGYLRPFPYDTTHGALSKKEPCNVHENGAVAGCLTIPVTRKTKEVWISFSDVLWTKEVHSRHLNAAYRARHMRRFDVKKWVSSLQHEHACKVKEVAKYVAEYAQDVNYQAFNFSPAFYAHRSAYYDLAPLARKAGFPNFRFPFDVPQLPEIAKKLGTTMEKLMKDYQIPAAKRLIQVFDRLYSGKGAVLALDDPTGITMDLAALMSHHFDVFTNNPEDTYKLAINSAIVGVRDLVHAKAKEDMYAAARTAQGTLDPIILLTESGRRIYEKLEVKAEDLERAKKKAWQKYEGKYNEKKRKEFLDNYEKRLQKLDQDCIVPLAKAHVDWIKSKDLSECFRCNYDENDPDSGVVYTVTLLICIGGTQNVERSFGLYSKWLKADDFTDKENLLLRALILNQDEYAKIINKAAIAAQNAGPSFDWGEFWKGLIEQVGVAIDKLLKGTPDMLSSLVQRISGVITQLAIERAGVGPVPRALLALGAISKTPIVIVKYSGNLSGFQKAVAHELAQASGEAQHRKKVNERLRALKISGIELEGDAAKNRGKFERIFFVAIDMDELKAIQSKQYKKPEKRATAITKALKSVADAEELEYLEMSRWRAQIPGVMQRTTENLPFAASVIGTVLQIAAVYTLNKDLEKAAKTEKGKEEARARLNAGTVALIGAAVGVLETAQERWPALTLRYGQRVSDHLKRLSGIASRGLGFAGGIMLAACDLKAGNKAWDEGRTGLAVAYYISTGIGIASAVFILIGSSTVLGIVLVILAVGVALVISFLKDDPIQGWLENCAFGADTYQNLDREMNALKAAVS